MDGDYYQVVRDFREVVAGLPLMTPPGIILLKAKAWLDLSERRESGEQIDLKHIKKHRNDVFRLTMILPTGKSFPVFHRVYDDLNRFLSAFPAQSSDWQSIKAAVGKNPPLPPIEEVISALIEAFTPGS